MERVMMDCVQCAGDGECRPCRGCGRSGYFLALPGPDATPCPHCKGSGRCRGCQGSGQVVDWTRSWLPDIYVLASRVMPTSISCAAITGASWRYISIPASVLKRTHEAQRGWVRWRVQRHFRESEGRCPLFDNITGYAWRYARNRSIKFDT